MSISPNRRVVGVLGGMGPGATLEFMRRVLEITQADSDQEHIRLIVDSNPQVPDRTDFILARGQDPRPALIAMAQGLEGAGADFLVMPCNTAHYFLSDLQASVGVPIVDWPVEVARAASVLGVRRTGVLATTGTLVSGIYARALDRFGIEYVVPSNDCQQGLMEAIYQIKHEGISRQRMAGIEGALHDLASRQTDSCLLACTEVSWACHGWEPGSAVRLVDGMDVVARHVVHLAGGNLKVGSALI